MTIVAAVFKRGDKWPAAAGDDRVLDAAELESLFDRCEARYVVRTVKGQGGRAPFQSDAGRDAANSRSDVNSRSRGAEQYGQWQRVFVDTHETVLRDSVAAVRRARSSVGRR